jgi:hypothetical protein
MKDAIDWVAAAEMEDNPYFRAQYLHQAREALPALENPKLERELSRRISAIETPSFIGPKPFPNRQ